MEYANVWEVEREEASIFRRIFFKKHQLPKTEFTTKIKYLRKEGEISVSDADFSRERKTETILVLTRLRDPRTQFYKGEEDAIMALCSPLIGVCVNDTFLSRRQNKIGFSRHN